VSRLQRLRERLAAAGLRGAVIRRPADVCYLTGYYAVAPPRPTFAVVGPERAVLVAPGSAEAGSDVSVVGYDLPGLTIDRVVDVEEESAGALATAIEGAGLGGVRFGLDPQTSLRHADVARGLGTTVPLTDEVEVLRRVKDDAELSLIRAAVACNDVGFAAARGAIHAGASELDVQAAVVAAMQRAAGVPIDVTGATNDLLSGPRTVGFGGATDRRLEAGDLVVIDLNPVIRAYKGDTTRTFVVGPASPGQRRMHAVVLNALAAAERAARPGVTGREVYAAFADTVVEAGYGAGLRGHGGHAIGLEHFERPYIIPGDDVRLEEGMVISLEPGIYVPGVGGMRVEDNYLVTASGLELLSQAPRDLLRCP
jgi:Xaa-Pro aminopeptidase